jgi:hypothetical protein
MDLIKIWTWPGQILQILSGMLLALVYAFGFMMYPAFFADAILRGVIIAVMAPLAAAASTLAATRRIALKALWGLAQAALTMVFASVAAGLASQSVNAVYATLTSADGTALSDWPTLIGALEAGTVHLSIVDQAYWAILALGVITIFMIRGAARMAAALTDLPPDEFSGATAGIATLAAAGARMTVGAAQRVGLGGPMTPLVPRVTRLIGNQGASLAGKVGRRKDRRGRAKRGASASKDAG